MLHTYYLSILQMLIKYPGNLQRGKVLLTHFADR